MTKNKAVDTAEELPGEQDRQAYTLDDIQRTALADAMHEADDNPDHLGVAAFWKAAADRMGFLPATVTLASNFLETGDFSAWEDKEEGDEEALDLSEEVHNSALERMRQQAREAVLQDTSLVADARDFLLGQIKARPKPWSATSNQEQRDVAAACEFAGRELVRKIIEAIAATGREPIRALLTKVTLGDDIIVNLKAKPFTPEETDAAVMALHRAHGKHVLITVASVDDHADPREPDVDADEPVLDFEPGDDNES